MAFCVQLKALLKKEFLLSKRHFLRTIFEVFVPVVCMALVVVIKLAFTPTVIEPGPVYTNLTTVAMRPNPSPFFVMKDLVNSAPFLREYFEREGFVLGIVNSSNDFASKVYNFINDFPFPVMSFSSEEDMLQYAANPMGKNVTTGLSFTDQEKNHYGYKLFFDKAIMTELSSNYNDELNRNPLTIQWNFTWISGIFFLKSVVDTLILRDKTNNPDAEITYGFTPMRYGETKQEAFAMIGDIMISFFFVVSMLIPSVVLIGKFMTDKVSRMRETMRMKGLSDFRYYLAYFLYFCMQQFIVCIVCTGIIKILIFPLANPILLFVLIYLFTVAIFPYAIIMSAVFDKPWMAQILGFMGFYMISTLSMFFSRSYLASPSTKLWSSLLPCVPFNLGIEIINRGEAAGIGLSFSNISTIKSYGITMVELYPFFLLDFVILLALGLYLTNVMPTPGGVRKPFYFFLMPSYWGCKGQRPAQRDDHTPLLDKAEENKEMSANFERLSGGMMGNQAEDKILRVSGLTKRFDEKPVVNQLNLELYTGQIFVLLGHNGAGKTTTISMLTGLLQPTAGKAKAFGVDIFDDMNAIIENIGVCTQDDIFFEELTVMEHIEIFGTFRGMSPAEITSSSNQLLTDLKLNHCKNTQAKNLSGGNKRRLMVALAFLGKPKLVFLDEPTSGMDTTLRREFWDVLAAYKRERIILLTTHYMDEADALGDNIGIMARGKLACCGSPMFLKKRFGIGYNLTISKSSLAIDSAPILAYIQKTIPTAAIESDLSGELMIRLPFSEASKFKAFFTELDTKMKELEIKAYGISITTMEEVFLRAGVEEGKAKNEVAEQKETKTLDKPTNPEFSLETSSQRSISEQFFVMIQKKFKEYMKNPSVLVFQFFLPILLMTVGFYSQEAMLSSHGHWYSVSNDLPGTSIALNDRSLMNNNDISNFVQGFSEQSKGNVWILGVDSNLATWESARNFAESIFENKTEYRQGSYLIYNADSKNHIYQFITMVNLLNPQAAFAFSHEMSQYIINRAASEKTEVHMKVQQMEVYEKIRAIANTMTKSSQFASWASLGLSFIPGLITIYLVHEFANDLKSHLLLSGLKLYVYWISYYLVDLVLLYIPVVFFIIFYKAFKLDIPYGWVLLLAYPPAQISFSYLTSLLFSIESSLFLIQTLVHYLPCVFIPNIILVLRLFDSTRLAAKIVTHVVSFFPLLSLVWGLFISPNTFLFGLIEKEDYTFWDYNVGLQPFLYMILEGPIYFVGLMLFEYIFGPMKREAE